MKILFLTEFFPRSQGGEISGGVEARDYYVARELSKTEEVSVLTSFLSETQKKESWGKLTIIRVGPPQSYTQTGKFLRRFIFALSVFKYAATADFDLLDANSGSTYLIAYWIALVRRKKVTYWIPDVLGFQATLKHFGIFAGLFEGWYEWFSLSFKPTHVISLSQTTSKKLLHLGYKKSQITVIYPGATTVTTRVHPKISRIITVQRLYQYKRADLLIEAVGLLKKSYPQIKLQIIGHGTNLPRLKSLVQRLALTKNVIFLGNLPHNEVLQKISQSDVFSLPSEIEGFGIVTLEAMSRGLPFVNSDIPVHQEIVAQSQAGLLFRSGDAHDLATNLAKIFSSRRLYLKLQKNALHFSQIHTWQKVARKTRKFYQKL